MIKSAIIMATTYLSTATNWLYMCRTAIVTAVLSSFALVQGGCSPLSLFNAVTPSDKGGVLIKSNVAFGEHPRQKLDVYGPAKPVKSAPVVVIIYGGSWNSGRKADYAFLGRALASRGFVAVVADYRLVPNVRFPAFLDDSARAVVWAHSNARAFGGDPNRVFVFGHSAGAYNAVMIALDERYLTTAGSHPSILRGVVGLSGPYDFLPLDVASTQQAFGHTKDLSQTQPINFVRANAPAMFLASGDMDTTVYPRNTLRLADDLKRQGNSVDVQIYPGLGHIDIMLALSVPFRSKAPVLNDIAKFIDSTP